MSSRMTQLHSSHASSLASYTWSSEKCTLISRQPELLQYAQLCESVTRPRPDNTGMGEVLCWNVKPAGVPVTYGFSTTWQVSKFPAEDRSHYASRTYIAERLTWSH